MMKNNHPIFQAWPWRKRRLSFVQQHSTSECGLACLSMILKFYGRATPLSELREAFPVGRDGLDLKKILAIAKHFKLATRAFRTERTDLLAIGLPVMVHWKFSHWVIVESYSKSKVVIIDPGIGKQKISHAEFSKCFTGVLISFKRGELFERRRRGRKSVTWKFLYRLLGDVGGWRFIPVIVASSLLLQTLSLALPFIMKIVVDGILPQHISSALTLLAQGMLLIAVTNVVASLLRSLAVLRLRTSLDLRSTTEVLRQLLALPFNFFLVHSKGDLITRITGFGTIRQIVTDYGISAALDGIFMVIYLGWLYILSPTLANVVVAFAVFQILALVITNGLQERLAKAMYLASAEEMTCLVDSLSNIDYLKASGSEEAAWERWSNLLRGELRADNERALLYVVLNVISRACNVGGPLTILWIGTRLVLANQISPGAMLSASAVAGSIFLPLANSIYTLQQLQGAKAHIERLDDVISSPKEIDEKLFVQDLQLGGEIELKEVAFSYPGAGTPLLDHIDLHVYPGEFIALVGPTGSGKSTLATLLIGLNAPTSGKVLFDGVALSDLAQKRLRQQIGYVPQSPLLFRGTLRDNIAFGLPNANLEDIIQACRLACIHDEIAALPLGFDTVIAEQGLNISGGQRQRVAIARALIRNPRVLVLDEATSHLDSETEDQIDSMLDALSCTRIVIAHRLSTVRKADRIYVIENGHIVESGSHEALMMREGRYAAMVQSQSRQTLNTAALERD